MLKNFIESKASETEFRKLSALGAKLRIPVPEAFLTMEVTMPDGEIIHSHSQRSHSYTRNFYNFMASQALFLDFKDTTWGAGLLSCKITVPFAIVYQNSPMNLSSSSASSETSDTGGINAAAAQDSYGIVVGTGVTAESFEDYKLDTPITNGNSSGKLAFAGQKNPVRTYVAGTKTWTAVHTRFFNNNSGGSIDIGEVGVVAYFGSYTTLITRDVITPVSLPDTGQLKAQYTFGIVFPA